MQLHADDGRARDPGGSPFAYESGCARPARTPRCRSSSGPGAGSALTRVAARLRGREPGALAGLAAQPGSKRTGDSRNRRKRGQPVWRSRRPTVDQMEMRTRESSRYCAPPTRRLGSSSTSLPRGRLCDSSAKHRSASLLRVRPEGSPRSTSSLRHPGRGLIPTRGSRATSVGGAPTLSLSNVIDERRQCPRAGSHRQADKPLVTREPRDHLPSWGGDPSADRRRSIGSRSRRP
jgi:hypothetical protein